MRKGNQRQLTNSPPPPASAMSWFKSKIKMVAARASNALAQAADIVAPTLYESRVDEFHHRWTTVSRFLASILHRELDPQEQRRMLNESHTRDALQRLVVLIFEEENETDKEELTRETTPADGVDHTAPHDQALRPCLEYLLERQLISHLCDAGRRDQPCGIMSLALQFVSALLSRVNHPILPAREVHTSVVALIHAASKKEVEDPVVRKCLIALLNVLWKKLRCDPVQTEFFFLQADRSSTGQGISDLVLFTGLLPHMNASNVVGDKCREALAIAASFHEPSLGRFILKLTPFCHYAVNSVVGAYNHLPKTRPERLPRSGNTSNANSMIKDIDVELQTLATRLRFCCTLAMVGQYELSDDDAAVAGMSSRSSITGEILALFREQFLDGPLVDGLMHTSEATARTATLYARIVLEELASCGRDTSANPLLLVFVQFLVDRSTTIASDEDSTAMTERRLPLELMHRMDSLSSSLSIATMDLFTGLLELQDAYVDRALLSRAASDVVVTSSSRRRASIGTLSPRGQPDSAIWLASRFPDSAVAANAHIWKIQAFNSLAADVEIPASALNDSEASEHQIVSLLSYIADAEYQTCQRAPAVIDDCWEDEDDDADDTIGSGGGESTPRSGRRDSDGAALTGSSRTAAARNAVKPLKQVTLTLSIPSYSPVPAKIVSPAQEVKTALSTETPLFVRLVMNRLERVLESSFYESLALSGLISTLAQKDHCASVVFDMEEARGSGDSIRSILEEVHADAVRRTSRLANGKARLHEIHRKLVEEDNETSLNDHEPETRLLCGYIVLEEILKELCSIAFAKDRVRSLPVKPEGYYLEPKRLSSLSAPCTAPGEGEEVVSRASLNIGREFEQLIADAESTMGSLLVSPTGADALRQAMDG